MTAIVKFTEILPAHTWRWRDRSGAFTTPSEMETRHLFYTLRMIWNNFMPTYMRVGRVKLYRFSPHYSPAYLRDAIGFIGNELSTRTDMRADWAEQLDEMRRWFVTEHPQIEAHVKLLETIA